MATRVVSRLTIRNSSYKVRQLRSYRLRPAKHYHDDLRSSLDLIRCKRLFSFRKLEWIGSLEMLWRSELRFVAISDSLSLTLMVLRLPAVLGWAEQSGMCLRCEVARADALRS